MSNPSREDLVSYRIEQADDALEQAKLLYANEHAGGAVNRAYYAMFYAVQALIAKHGVNVSKHGGAIAFFDRHIIKERKLDTHFSKWLHWLFDLRQDADYGTAFSPNADQTEEALVCATKFVHEIKQKITDL